MRGDRTTCVYQPKNGTFHATIVYKGELVVRTFCREDYDSVYEMVADAYSWIEYVTSIIDEHGSY